MNYSNAMNWMEQHPNVVGSLLGGAMTLGGGALAGRGQEKANESNLQAEKLRTAATLLGNPLEDQGRRNQLGMMRQLLLGNLNVTAAPPAHLAGVTGGVTMPTLTDAQMPFLQPGAMAAAEAPRWNMINQLAPGTLGPGGLGAMGYGDAANSAAVGNAVAGGASSPQDEFNARFSEIQAAKRQTGDWEKAYQQVTGKAWPKGQHIVINGDGTGGEMVKDQSKWKRAANAALTIAPIAAAPFTGGTSLALIGAGAGAAKSALNGGGVKGALAGGAMGALAGVGSAGTKVPFSLGALGKQMTSAQGLAAMAGTMDNKVGAAARMAAPFLPGAKFGPSGPQATGMPGPMNPREGLGLPGAGEMLGEGRALPNIPTLQGGANPALKSAGAGKTAAAAVQKAVGKGMDSSFTSQPFTPTIPGYQMPKMQPGSAPMPPMDGNPNAPMPPGFVGPYQPLPPNPGLGPWWSRMQQPVPRRTGPMQGRYRLF